MSSPLCKKGDRQSHILLLLALCVTPARHFLLLTVMLLAKLSWRWYHWFCWPLILSSISVIVRGAIIHILLDFRPCIFFHIFVSLLLYYFGPLYIILLVNFFSWFWNVEFCNHNFIKKCGHTTMKCALHTFWIVCKAHCLWLVCCAHTKLCPYWDRGRTLNFVCDAHQFF